MTDLKHPSERAEAQLWAERVQALENEIERLSDLLWQEAGNRVEIERLRTLLGKLYWKSIDKDNMEYICHTSCYVRDEIRAALEPKP